MENEENYRRTGKSKKELQEQVDKMISEFKEKHPGEEVPYALVYWVDNMATDKDVEMARQRVLNNPELQKMNHKFHCHKCSAVFEHPVENEELGLDCETKEGMCPLLYDAGWRYSFGYILHQAVWFCKACVPFQKIERLDGTVIEAKKNKKGERK